MFMRLLLEKYWGWLCEDDMRGKADWRWRCWNYDECHQRSQVVARDEVRMN